MMFDCREAFAKLSLGDETAVSVQELFPWTLNHKHNKHCHTLKSADSFL